MDELSLYVLDITMNSVRAGATEITVSLVEDGQWLTFTVTDNGCGMTEEQVKRLTDPFFTTRKTRKVGLGIPFLTMLAEMTGGHVTVTSVHESVSEDHGTTTKAVFDKTHLDFVPLGDMIETVKTLIQGSPDVNFTYIHTIDGREVRLSCAELKTILGEEIPLNEPDILEWIGGFLAEQYEAVKNGNE
ncbi:MAG: sensor histidine kinase [Clostridia bacterium]|nr:sensor histidine kinase [Clostridia bacterium]MBQ8332572.1 sensor histidine kinase [Clostridia bacterium]MBQ8371204.1 sensor histidine kinase [Clostridia bacterium]MBQ8513213.1 sensor histidine kinase [Clostridia bacterium]